MKSKSNQTSVFFAAAGMTLLILDSKCALSAAGQALDLCLRTVIPGLFPMFVLSGLVVSGLGSGSGAFTQFLERLLGLPPGSGKLFLIGSVGGFPVGAQCITQAVQDGSLSSANGERMLGFCNNCSPAFLFGIAGAIFPDLRWPLMLFLIQLESAVILASLTNFDLETVRTFSSVPITMAQAVSRAIRSMATVCGWVVLAGVITGFLDRWFYPLLPGYAPNALSGILEITGGVIGLSQIPDHQTRFVLCSCFLCFGGLCVQMQIRSLASSCLLSGNLCLRQKVMQGVLGFLLASGYVLLGPVVLIFAAGIPFIRKIILEKPRFTVYNNSHKGGFDHVVPK